MNQPSANPGSGSDPSESPSWSSRLRNLRDIVLVGAGVSYVIGYIVWSVNAWQNQLGLLPVLDFQYVVAGSIPMVMIILGLAAFVGMLRLKDTNWFLIKETNWFVTEDEKANIWRKRLRTGVSSTRNIALFLIIAAAVLTGLELEKIAAPLFLGSFIWLLLTIWFEASVYERAVSSGTGIFATIERWLTKITRWIALSQGFYIVAGLLVFGLVFYTVEVYPRLPQEFGGGRPRCAHLEISRHRMSSDSLAQIFDPKVLKSENPFQKKSLQPPLI
ncbi:MAG: hypothetical protein BZY88_07775 [SAR202 cluster bacterium Io17-Chloro-G9]|nr:MAG: hypothetical protein BZY88_07775 [SAR202 cluster bacterium Io17-Chloro-G9]